MLKTSLLFLAIFGLSGFAGPAKAKRALLKYEPGKAASVSRKSGGTLKLSFSVEKGFHVQANPASEKFLIPTELKLDSNPKFEMGKVFYPPCKAGKALGPCKPHRIAGSDKAINAYEGTFQISVPIKPASSVTPGAYTLEGKLKYQACNDQLCFPPTTIPLKVALQVAK